MVQVALSFARHRDVTGDDRGVDAGCFRPATCSRVSPRSDQNETWAQVLCGAARTTSSIEQPDQALWMKIEPAAAAARAIAGSAPGWKMVSMPIGVCS